MVTTKFDLPSLRTAHLTVYAEVINYTDEEQDAVVKGKINNNIEFQQKVHLMPNEKKQISFTPAIIQSTQYKKPKNLVALAIW